MTEDLALYALCCWPSMLLGRVQGEPLVFEGL